MHRLIKPRTIINKTFLGPLWGGLRIAVRVGRIYLRTKVIKKKRKKYGFRNAFLNLDFVCTWFNPFCIFRSGAPLWITLSVTKWRSHTFLKLLYYILLSRNLVTSIVVITQPRRHSVCWNIHLLIILLNLWN